MIDFHGVILADAVAAQLADVTLQMHAAAIDPNAPAVCVLLCGRPGVGKTAVMRALAEDARFTGIHVGATDVRSPYIGQSSNRLRQLFARARASAPALLMFDSFEHIFTRRDDFRSSPVTEESVMELLTAIDGGGRGRHGPAVCLVGEVVALDLVDRSVLSRIPTRIELPLPDDQCRVEILRRLADRAGVSLGADPDATIATWSSELRGSTGRELEHFVRGIAQRQIVSTDERRLVAVSTDVSRTAVDASPPSAQESESTVAGTSVGKDSDRSDGARDSLSSLGIGDALLEQLQAHARLVRARDSDEWIRTVLPRAFLFRGTTDAALRCARAFAVEANLPCRVLDGAGALAAERSDAGLLQARLDQIRTTGPCAVIITDAERLVAARGTSQYERAMGTAWVALRRHFDAQREGGSYVPLIFTSTDLETMDQAILLRATLRFELSPPPGVGHS